MSPMNTVEDSSPSASSKAPYTHPPDAVWFITGCSSGLGLSLARQVLAASPTHRLVATARDARRRLPSLLPVDSPRVLALDLDVTSPESITAALDAVLTHPGFGRIDVLGECGSTSPIS